MSNKTISINPSLFSVGGSKTKKNREKKVKPTAVPLISPNVLKNKLLKRIKEHKQKETQDLANNKRKLDNINNTNVEPIKSFEKFNDEFTDSINYLQTLSKQKKIDAEKKNYEDLQQRRKEELERRTIRNYHELNVNVQPRVNIDLPDELIQTTITEPLKINPPQNQHDVPYGVLKGGLKPSYREWARTHRNNIVTNPNSSLIIQGGMNSQQTARENRLNLLRQKIKNKSEETKVDPILTENLIKKPNPNVQSITSQVIQPIVQPIVQPTVQPVVEQTTGKLVATKHITKKTIKRKYTLGRSNIKRTVSVLIKDRGTRKKVLTAQKDLRRKNINDIKLYLREHNLIKTGSNAPNDVLRKLYESAMLSGEITNNNTETLLHNLSKEDKEL
jgi:hypothetical protein